VLKHLVPSTELATRIQRWIDETDAPDVPRSWPRDVFRKANALLVGGYSPFLWGLRPSGELLRLDLDCVGQTLDPEDDPRYVYAILAQASRHYPDLRELMPEQPPGVHQCPDCGGSGDPPAGSDACSCRGSGGRYRGDAPGWRSRGAAEHRAAHLPSPPRRSGMFVALYCATRG